MNVGILGSGVVGQTFSAKLVELGRAVMLGTFAEAAAHDEPAFVTGVIRRAAFGRQP